MKTNLDESNRLPIIKPGMSIKTLKSAAAELGRKGGKASGACKAREGMSERLKAYWASPRAAGRRKKPKPQT